MCHYNNVTFVCESVTCHYPSVHTQEGNYSCLSVKALNCVSVDLRSLTVVLLESARYLEVFDLWTLLKSLCSKVIASLNTF